MRTPPLRATTNQRRAPPRGRRRGISPGSVWTNQRRALPPPRLPLARGGAGLAARSAPGARSAGDLGRAGMGWAGDPLLSPLLCHPSSAVTHSSSPACRAPPSASPPALLYSHCAATSPMSQRKGHPNILHQAGSTSRHPQKPPAKMCVQDSWHRHRLGTLPHLWGAELALSPLRGRAPRCPEGFLVAHDGRLPRNEWRMQERGRVLFIHQIRVSGWAWPTNPLGLQGLNQHTTN